MPFGEGQPATLAARIAAGDHNAFQAFFDCEVGGLVRYIAGVLGSRDDAREVAQEAFFRLWQNRRQLLGDAHPVRLLYTIARNLARDHLRHRAVEQRWRWCVEALHALEVDALLPDEATDERLAAVQHALATLSPRQREIVLLRWERQLTYEQIGAELGIAPGTASAHMQRAIAQLKRMMRPPIG